MIITNFHAPVKNINNIRFTFFSKEEGRLKEIPFKNVLSNCVVGTVTVTEELYRNIHEAYLALRDRIMSPCLLDMSYQPSPRYMGHLGSFGSPDVIDLCNNLGSTIQAIAPNQKLELVPFSIGQKELYVGVAGTTMLVGVPSEDKDLFSVRRVDFPYTDTVVIYLDCSEKGVDFIKAL